MGRKVELRECFYNIIEMTVCAYAYEKVSTAREEFMVKQKEGGIAE